MSEENKVSLFFMSGKWHEVTFPADKAGQEGYDRESIYNAYWDESLPEDVEVEEGELDHIWSDADNVSDPGSSSASSIDKDLVDRIGLDLLTQFMKDPETELFCETRKITLVDLDPHRLEIEWVGYNPGASEHISRVTFRRNYSELGDDAPSRDIKKGHPLYTYAKMVIEVAD